MGDIQSQLRPGGSSASRAPSTVPTREEIAEAREALRVRFLVLAPRRVAALQDALRAAAEDEAARRELQRQGHQLRGTAATVGLLDLGLLGGVIERAAASSPFSSEEQARASAAVALADEYVSLACSHRAVGPIADDPRFRALVTGSQ